MQPKKHLYSLSYDTTEIELSKLESKYLFNQEDKDKLFFSDVTVAPSTSAFIKRRIDIISFSPDYDLLISQIKAEKIVIDDFKVEYLVFEGDPTEYPQRLSKLKDIGYSIDGDPDYYNPTTTYALCYYQNYWCFGILNKNNYAWQEHNNKPCSYSNSISIHIAKALVNIAAKGDQTKKLLDACCGVGTIMLEACFAGYYIEGCDINWKVCRDARENLAHFEYTSTVHRSDIKSIIHNYDAAIIDLPYNLLSDASESDMLHIIKSSAEITDRLVIVSTTDISKLIDSIGFKISDICNVPKKGKTTFARKIWVCEKG